jgi:hypothetical protein
MGSSKLDMEITELTYETSTTFGIQLVIEALVVRGI